MNLTKLSEYPTLENNLLLQKLAICIAIIFIMHDLNAQTKNSKLTITVGPEFSIEKGGKQMRQFPFLERFGKNIFVSFSQDSDAYTEHPVAGMRISANNGNSWPVYMQMKDFVISSMIRLNETTLLGSSYIAYYKDSMHAETHYSKSEDQGLTWTNYSGTVAFPQAIKKLEKSNWSSIDFHRTMILFPDGFIQGTMYGYYASDTKYRTLWVKSTDMGANWTVVSTIAYNPHIGTESFCEPVVARCLNGSLLCVMRVGTNCPLYQCRSNDNGKTWSRPVTLPGIDTTSTFSVDPDLCLMSNGVLVLSYGRPNCHMLFSLDGSGNSWGNLTSTYQDKTSGYTGVREISPNRLLLIGDKGPNWLSPESYEIWGKYIDVVRK